MLILAMDSSATVASVALCRDGELLGEFTVNNGNTHSETLLPMVEALLKISGITVADVDAFACSSGPGSFTGVRIGTATLKGLAFDLKKPCIEVSTLEALAYNLVMERGVVCPVMNARRGQVYTALFSSNGSTLTRLSEDMAISIEELEDKLSEYKKEHIFFSGDGYDITVKALKKTDFIPTPERLTHESAYSVAKVAEDMWKKGLAVSDPDFRVKYLRPSQAERELREKLSKNNA
ncbi:MAG: tRNA (adenosine(37)-N6)-threonylcarbamoyltransferase complex dimerization subunit type 1 TsaB [Clostridia bacterium]|nr:tRNA (adenosine(37)-N6)-threonylcarbamoyltransferase complex dimerization subunit type 1 TsaB [Clostridia bacterium]